MATLSDAKRIECNNEMMRENTTTFGAVIKSDLKAAVDAIDQWISDNSASFNSAIPQPARAQLTSPQKARLLMIVVRKRFLEGV